MTELWSFKIEIIARQHPGEEVMFKMLTENKSEAWLKGNNKHKKKRYD
jgi:hypothetical protein